MALPLTGYVRVSRIGGRAGPSFVSPAIQRDAIERLARAAGVEVGEVVEEMDVSGKKAARDRLLGQVVADVEAGRSGGLVAWRVSRISRSLIDGVTTVDRITRAGGRVLAEDLPDTAGPMGRALLGLLLGLAEAELEQRRAGWAEARERAAGRGAWPGRPPIGYAKAPDGVLVPDDRADLVRDLFAARAAGASLSTCGVVYADHTGTVPTRGRLARIFASRTYTGDIINGELVEHGTHPAIVDRATWERAQGVQADAISAARGAARTGSVAGAGLLRGVARCATCGGALHVGARGTGAAQRPMYGCRDGNCLGRATADVAGLDQLVVDGLAARGIRVDDGIDRAAALRDVYGPAVDAAILARHAAERELLAYAAVPVESLGREAYATGAVLRREAARAAEAAEVGAIAAALAVRAGDPAVIRREVIRAAVEAVRVSPAVRDGSGPGGWQPLAERVEVVFALRDAELSVTTHRSTAVPGAS